MKKVVLAAAAAVLLPTSVFAADLPSRRAPPVYVPPPVPVFTWTGFYLGANAGYAFDSRRSYTLDPTNAIGVAALGLGQATPLFRSRGNGFTGGGQIGYNYQLGSAFGLGGGGVVIGVEADAAYTDLRQGGDFVANGFDSSYRSRTDFVGTVRGRIGYAFDNFLVYGTGGFAYGGVRDAIGITSVATGALQVAGNRDTIKTGYAYGGGVEYAIPTTSFLNFFHSSAVTLKAEFIHYDLGTSVRAIAPVVSPATFNSRIRTEGNLVRAGINYKFETFTPAPVVARY